MRSVSLTLRDLKPQPLVRRKSTNFELWRSNLESHLRYMVENRSIHHAAPRIESLLDYVDTKISDAVAPSGSGTVEIQAGRFFYFLANLELRRDALRRTSDDEVLNQRLLQLKELIGAGHEILRLPKDLEKLRSDLQGAVNHKNEKEHSAILARWSRRQSGG